MTRRAVFLDRDGVLNRAIVRNGKPYPPRTMADFELLPGVEDACRSLRDAGYLLIVVTNQPDVARGTTSRAEIEAFNTDLKQRLAIDEIRTCYHDDSDNCACRKPKPGLLVEAAATHGIDLMQSFMIGDRWRDIEAGRAAGCRTIFIDYQYQERQPDQVDRRASSLLEAAHWIRGLASEEQCRLSIPASA